MKNPSLNLIKNSEPRLKSLRFDVFKGSVQADNSVLKIRSVGAAVLLEGHRTFSLYLNTFLKDVFYLVPGQKRYTSAEYVIMSRQNSSKPGKKFVWKPVGEARSIQSGGFPLLTLSWDLLGAGDIYMSLTPISETGETAMTEALKEVLSAC